MLGSVSSTLSTLANGVETGEFDAKTQLVKRGSALSVPSTGSTGTPSKDATTGTTGTMASASTVTGGSNVPGATGASVGGAESLPPLAVRAQHFRQELLSSEFLRKRLDDADRDTKSAKDNLTLKVLDNSSSLKFRLDKFLIIF